MSEPKLGIITPHLGLPSETFIRRHVNDLLPGRTVLVAGSHQSSFWSADGPSLILDRRFYLLRRLGYDDQRAAGRFLQKNGVTTVLAEWLDYSLPWLDMAKKRGFRFFAHAHGWDVAERQIDVHRDAYARYNDGNGVITVTRLMRQRLASVGVREDKVHIIPYGVDVPPECPPHEKQATIRCLAVGRMVTKKAPLLTLEAFRAAAERCPALRLDYVGDGPLFGAVKEKILEWSLETRVTLHGALPSDQVRRMMLEADLFVLHSLTDPETGDEEGLPVVILEAMASGLPVVSTRHSGIPEAVEDGITGYLVAEGDVAATSERIVALAEDPALRRSYGTAGWKAAVERFSWERERQELLRVMQL